MAWAVGLSVLFLVTVWINFQIWKLPDVMFVENDVGYYRWAVWCLQGGGLTGGDPGCVEAAQSFGVLGEYPVPAVWFLQLIYTMSGGAAGWTLGVCLALLLAGVVGYAVLRHAGRSTLGLVVAGAGLIAAVGLWVVQAYPQSVPGAQGGQPPAMDNFSTWFVVAMILIHATVAILLFRSGRPHGSLFWILFMGACGPIVWLRFDIVTAALVALACLWLARHPALAGGLVGFGAALKLWPALLFFPMAAPNPLKSAVSRWRVIGFVVVGVGLGLASLVTSGWQRSASSIEWQSLRGLQQESVPATPLVFLRAFTDNPPWELKLSEYKAVELFGPGVAQLLTVSTVLTGLSFVLTAVLTWRLFRNVAADSPRLTEAIIWSVFAVLLATMVANKVLSTQYVQWLAGPVAALYVTQRSAWLRRPLNVAAVGLVAVAALSHYTYPWATFGIMGLPNASGYEAASLILRNLLLVALLALATLVAWRATRAVAPSRAEREPVPAELAETGATRGLTTSEAPA